MRRSWTSYTLDRANLPYLMVSDSILGIAPSQLAGAGNNTPYPYYPLSLLSFSSSVVLVLLCLPLSLSLHIFTSTTILALHPPPSPPHPPTILLGLRRGRPFLKIPSVSAFALTLHHLCLARKDPMSLVRGN